VKLVARKEQEAILTEEPDYDNELLKQLKEVRFGLAEMENVPAYNIVTDISLVEIATYLPLSYDNLKRISGFGDYKIHKYGPSFLKVVQDHCRNNNLESKIHFKTGKPEKKVKEKKIGPSNTEQTTFALYSQGMSIAEIAESRGISQSTVENHLGAFVADGTLDATRLVPQQKLDKIAEAIRQSGQTFAAKPIKDLLGDEYTYGDIRIGLEYYKRNF
jgi:ATP-dependent DNA helicase RecQ